MLHIFSDRLAWRPVQYLHSCALKPVQDVPEHCLTEKSRRQHIFRIKGTDEKTAWADFLNLIIIWITDCEPSELNGIVRWQTFFNCWNITVAILPVLAVNNWGYYQWMTCELVQTGAYFAQLSQSIVASAPVCILFKHVVDIKFKMNVN